MSWVFFFFFQAEDGIRDSSVTGVQTCALPISVGPGKLLGAVIGGEDDHRVVGDAELVELAEQFTDHPVELLHPSAYSPNPVLSFHRSDRWVYTCIRVVLCHRKNSA